MQHDAIRRLHGQMVSVYGAWLEHTHYIHCSGTFLTCAAAFITSQGPVKRGSVGAIYSVNVQLEINANCALNAEWGVVRSQVWRGLSAGVVISCSLTVASHEMRQCRLAHLRALARRQIAPLPQ